MAQSMNCISVVSHGAEFDVCHTKMFQITKQIEILDKDNTSKYKMQFSEWMCLLLTGKKIQT